MAAIASDIRLTVNETRETKDTVEYILHVEADMPLPGPREVPGLDTVSWEMTYRYSRLHEFYMQLKESGGLQGIPDVLFPPKAIAKSLFSRSSTQQKELVEDRRRMLDTFVSKIGDAYSLGAMPVRAMECVCSFVDLNGRAPEGNRCNRGAAAGMVTGLDHSVVATPPIPGAGARAVPGSLLAGGGADLSSSFAAAAPPADDAGDPLKQLLAFSGASGAGGVAVSPIIAGGFAREWADEGQGQGQGHGGGFALHAPQMEADRRMSDAAQQQMEDEGMARRLQGEAEAADLELNLRQIQQMEEAERSQAAGKELAQQRAWQEQLEQQQRDLAERDTREEQQRAMQAEVERQCRETQERERGERERAQQEQREAQEAARREAEDRRMAEQLQQEIEASELKEQLQQIEAMEREQRAEEERRRRREAEEEAERQQREVQLEVERLEQQRLALEWELQERGRREREEHRSRERAQRDLEEQLRHQERQTRELQEQIVARQREQEQREEQQREMRERLERQRREQEQQQATLRQQQEVGRPLCAESAGDGALLR
jgi:hypothetical protein